MRAIVRSCFVAIGCVLAATLGWAEPVLLSDVLAAPATYHGKVIQVSGLFWTDGEGAFLVEAPTDKLDLDRAIAVSADPKALVSDEHYQRLKADRLAYVRKKKEADPKATWVVFQAPAIFEGRVEDALSVPASPGQESRLAHPYGGCRIKIVLQRMVEYGARENSSRKK